MYKTDHTFMVLPIKDLINEDGDPTTPHKLATGKKPSVSHLRVLFCQCACYFVHVLYENILYTLTKRR